MRLTPLCLVAACAFVVGVSCTNPADASQIGVWQFNNNLDNDLPGGAAMSALGGWAPVYANEMIGGSPATQLSFPAMSSSQALDMPNQAGPNGGSLTTTNNWSIVMDVRFPSAGNYNSVWETEAVGTTDGDYFVRDTEGIGTSGQYSGTGTYTPSTWTRIAVTVDPAINPATYTLSSYVDGVFVGTATTSSPPDGKEAIGAVLHLFADNDGETAAGLVNSVAYYDEVLSANAIGLLGGASAAGIPAVPEPASLVLFGGALGLLALVRGRRLGLWL